MIADELCKIEANKCNNTENGKSSPKEPYPEQQLIYNTVIDPMINLRELSARSLKEDVDKEIEREISKLEKVNPKLSLYTSTERDIQKMFLNEKGGFDFSKYRVRDRKLEPKLIEESGSTIKSFMDHCISGIKDNKSRRWQ